MASLLCLLLLGSLACTPEPGKRTWEGRYPGECSDGADNDGDGLYDCDDSDCMGAPVCAEGDSDTDGDTDADTDADADADSDTDADADTDTDTDPFADLDWTGSSDLDMALALDDLPQESHWEVNLCVSSEGWGVGCDRYTTIAHGLSSLDLFVHEDGLIILGTPHITWYGAMEPDIAMDIQWRMIHAISTPDLVSWGTHLWDITDAEMMENVDPALSIGPDGVPRVIYYSVPDDAGVPAAEVPGPHPIKVASWNGDGFTERADPLWEIEGLMDPVLCELDGQYELLATCASEICRATSRDGWTFTQDEAFSFGGAQVPYCTPRNGELFIAAQGGGGWPPPLYRTMSAEGELSEQTLFYSDEENFSYFGGNCTSPVVGMFRDQYVMICASWITL